MTEALPADLKLQITLQYLATDFLFNSTIHVSSGEDSYLQMHSWSTGRHF
jgi:hypothetical protein